MLLAPLFSKKAYNYSPRQTNVTLKSIPQTKQTILICDWSIQNIPLATVFWGIAVKKFSHFDCLVNKGEGKYIARIGPKQKPFFFLGWILLTYGYQNLEIGKKEKYKCFDVPFCFYGHILLCESFLISQKG